MFASLLLETFLSPFVSLLIQHFNIPSDPTLALTLDLNEGNNHENYHFTNKSGDATLSMSLYTVYYSEIRDGTHNFWFTLKQMHKVCARAQQLYTSMVLFCSDLLCSVLVIISCSASFTSAKLFLGC
jgi:hypothetical protein